MLLAASSWTLSMKTPCSLGAAISTIPSSYGDHHRRRLRSHLCSHPDIHIPGTDLELRAYDLWGDTVQFAKEDTIATTLDTWRPRWRDFQTTVTSTEAVPRCPRRPLTLHLSCHRIVPGVILP